MNSSGENWTLGLILGTVGLLLILLFESSVWPGTSLSAPVESSTSALREENPEWPWDLIDPGRIRTGFSDNMVLASWGEPLSMDTATHPSEGRWYYKRHILTFEGEALAGIRNLEDASYDDIFRHNEDYLYKWVYFRGRIIQSMHMSGDEYLWRVATGISHGSYTEDVLLLRYSGHRYLEDDIVDFWGSILGLATYDAILGNQITIPELLATHVEFVR